MYFVFVPHSLITGKILFKILLKKCFFLFSLQRSSKTFLTLGGIRRDIVIYIYIYIGTSSLKVPVFLARFKSQLNFLYRFSDIPQILNSIKILPVRVDRVVPCDGTYMTNLTVAFHNTADAP